jgi:hypothetical protein
MTSASTTIKPKPQIDDHNTLLKRRAWARLNVTFIMSAGVMA